MVGGSKRYVDAIVARLGDAVRLDVPVTKITRAAAEVEVHTAVGPERFDQIVVATHSDQALDLLSDPSPAEREVLGAIRYQSNRATLHTDVRLLPDNRRAWASWNYHRLAGPPAGATLTYRLRSLQGIESRGRAAGHPQPGRRHRPGHGAAHLRLRPPVYDAAAVAAQTRHEELNGANRTWFAGAYWGYGFHEDGVQSARVVCRRLAGEDL